MNVESKRTHESVKISVIVPAYNAADTIADCLAALQKQTRPPDEIIVVDDGSTDETVGTAQMFGVCVLKQTHRGPAAARNLGVQAARGDIVMFTDADCVPHADWIEQMQKPFSDPKVVGVKGAYSSKQKQLIARLVQLEFEDKYDRMRQYKTIDFIDTYSAAYRRDVFVALGGFNEIFPTASVEDVEFSFRIAERNLRLVFAPRAQVQHRHPVKLVHYLRRKARYGYWRALVYLWHPHKIRGDSHSDPIFKIQFVVVIGGGISVLVGLWNPRYLLGMIGWAMLGLLATTMPFAMRTARKDWKVALIVPLVHGFRAVVQTLALVTGFLIHGILQPPSMTGWYIRRD